jgi:flagellar hook-basal body complex protein FliE
VNGVASTGVAAPAGGDGNGFSNALDAVQASQDNADGLAKAAATGNLTDIHNYTIAATEAQLTTQLTVAVRDRAVEAFNEIMRMQT